MSDSENSKETCHAAYASQPRKSAAAMGWLFATYLLLVRAELQEASLANTSLSVLSGG